MSHQGEQGRDQQQTLAAVMRYLKQHNLNETFDALQKEVVGLGTVTEVGSSAGTTASPVTTMSSNPAEWQQSYASVTPAHCGSGIMAQSSPSPMKDNLRPTDIHDDDRCTDCGYSAPSCQSSITSSQPQLASSPTVPTHSPISVTVASSTLPSFRSGTSTPGMLASVAMTSPPLLYPFPSPMTTMVPPSSIAAAHSLIAPVPNIFALVTPPQTMPHLGQGSVMLPPILPLPVPQVQPTTMQETASTIAQSPVTPQTISPLDVKALPSPPSSTSSSQAFHVESSDQTTKPSLPSISELRAFAEEFRRKRLSLGYTQGAVGISLAKMGFVNFAQSTISRFEQMQLSLRNAASIRDVLTAWMKHAERFPQGALADEETFTPPSLSVHPTGTSYGIRKRKKRAVFTPSARKILEDKFISNPRPTRLVIEQLAQKLDMLPEEVRVWFCNKRQKEKGELHPSTSSSVAEEEEADVHSLHTSSSSSPCAISSVSHPIASSQHRGSIPQNFRIEEMSKSSSSSAGSSEASSPSRTTA